jgi:hypothetical protein
MPHQRNRLILVRSDPKPLGPIHLRRAGPSAMLRFALFLVSAAVLLHALLQPHLPQSLKPLLVVAHPDDESMFFAPTVLSFVASGAQVMVLCLSLGMGRLCPLQHVCGAALHLECCPPTVTTGDAAGLGLIRQQEMRRACRRLGVRS